MYILNNNKYRCISGGLTASEFVARDLAIIVKGAKKEASFFSILPRVASYYEHVSNSIIDACNSYNIKIEDSSGQLVNLLEPDACIKIANDLAGLNKKPLYPYKDRYMDDL